MSKPPSPSTTHALNYLTDHAIDLEGEDEEILAGLRLELEDAIADAEGGAR